ncbi:phosphate transport system permease protein [Microbacterium sorbitolivorans]|uniref:Phosphate transport system permease protein n=1 Tax=Microbacterium sorbitolivorans TaxID=1867410 RepID=A0A367XU34_9MICO|nr:phosphate ABC transporter permease subunit PstC [Microbacterium sorbitolivorans]RCK57128.1 phosphate ABC transporter permease subunit PstC [Microbacterium sorbitolivorans]GGF46452.1 phosphate transport system permease protein [Microbacterium sorbitolivorans]HLT67824.1 phosphate ABC transporter permease subunit PstC [Microbacterium sp.]
MSTTEKAPARQAPPEGSIKAKKRPGDLAFSGSSLGAGIIILIVLAATAVFLVVQSIPAIAGDADTNPILGGENFWSYALPFLFGTLWSALLALAIASPIAIGIALFISHYAPRRLAAVLGYIIDLLAAVPSVVFGLWGALFFSGFLQPFFATLTDTIGTWPILNLFFSGPVSATGRTVLTAALVLSVMILPIMTAICREVFLQTPKLHEEAALALGATRWEMIRMAVLPFARGGMVSGAMLGLGRALGETMAVTMVLSGSPIVAFQLLQSGNPQSIAANIALHFPEAFDTGVNTLIATGLILFIVTFAVNAVARWIVNRRAEFSGAN